MRNIRHASVFEKMKRKLIKATRRNFTPNKDSACIWKKYFIYTQEIASKDGQVVD